jgi:pfkB family carbohydrate kinase
VKRGLRVDYTTVGHVTVDVMRDGSRRPGGTAFYSALQAARLGLRTLIVTRGVPREIAALLEPYRGELELEILAAPQTTMLATRGSGATRSQRVLAWAGAIDEHVAVDTSILHLAPVARETPGRWQGFAGFVGLTPQGLVRAWSGDCGDIFAAAPQRGRIPGRCQAVVMSEHERTSSGELIAAAAACGAIVAVTAGASPTTLLCAGGDALVDVPTVANPTDDVGAGDVFAAAFFIALHEGRAPRLAADFANAAAAVRIGAAGADAIGGREVIEARLRAVA